MTEIPSGTQTIRQWVVLYFSLVPRTRTTVKASYRPIKFQLHAWYMRKVTITAFSLLLPPPRPKRKRRKTAAWRCITQHPCHAFPILFIVNKSNKNKVPILSPQLNWAHSVDIWVRWSAKPQYRIFNTNMLEKGYCDWWKLNEPKPDALTLKNPQVAKAGNAYPQPR